MYVNKVRGNNGREQCLAVQNGRIANDSRLILWDCQPGDPSQTFASSSDNLLHIGGPGSPFCVAAYDHVQNASRIGVWQCQPGDPTQSFSMGMYSDITVARTNFCLGVQNGSNAPGSPLILWNCNKNGNDDQSWSTRRIGSASATPASAPTPAPALHTAPSSVAIQPSAVPGFLSHNGSALAGNSTVLNYNGVRLASTLLGPGGSLIGQDGAGIVAAGGGNFIDTKTGLLMSRNGSPLMVGYQVISPNGSNIIAAGGGNIVAAGGGNIVAAGGGNIVAAGGGNLLASANGFSVYNPSFIASLLQQMNSALLSRSQVQLAQSATAGINNNMANIATNNGANFHVQSVGGAPASPAPQPAPGLLSGGVSAVISGVQGVQQASSAVLAGRQAQLAQSAAAALANSTQARPPAIKQVMYINKVRGSNGRDQCLTVQNGRIANDSRLVLSDCLSGDPGQTFWFSSDNLLHIGGPSSQYCVAAYDRVENASRLGVWQCQPGNPTQTFSAGMYSDVVVAQTNFCMGVQNGSNAPGSPLILWNCNKKGNDDQSWSVRPNFAR